MDSCNIYIYISDNNLTSLPASVGGWTSVTYIWLYNNNLTTLPPEVVGWRSAIKIKLFNNNLTTLPPLNILSKCEDYDFVKLIGEIQEKNMNLEEENKNLKEENSNLKAENLHLRYAYGGTGYQSALEDFESHKSDQ